MLIFDDNCYKFSSELKKTSTVTESVVEHVKSGLETFYDGRKPLILSLSGGVDSMVLLDIFCKLGIDFHCLHIDYRNRLETETEAKYLQSYCTMRNVPLTCYRMPIQRDDKSLNRNAYERITKEKRFIEYNKLCEYLNTNIVCLGHHDDDVIENIICNILNNQSIGDLGKMHVKSGVEVEDGLQVVRLLIGKMKKDIYEYAEENKIFYFKDSTPKWSKRGQIRDNVLPQLENVFPGAREQLLRFNNINNSNHRLLQVMLDNYTNFDVRIKEDGSKILSVPGILNDKCLFLNEIGFWKYIFSEATKKLGCDGISQKSIEHFMDNIGKRKVILSKNIYVENNGGRFTLTSSPRKD